MTKRKMVRIVVIDDIVEHGNADALEIAKIGGWNVVVQKGLYSAGDKAAYFEIDSFLPEANPIFESFQKRGQKKFLVNGNEINGHVVKTIKLRGVVSQGLLMPLHEIGVDLTDYNVGDDISDLVGVVKYDVEKPKNADIIGAFDTRRSPKTDAERVQNLADHWDEIKDLDWEATVKIDGTSQTLFFDSEEERLRIFGRNWELDPETAEGLKVAEDVGIADFARENPDTVVQAELWGFGINANRLKINDRKLAVFAVWSDGVKVPRNEWDKRLLDNAAPLSNINPADFDSIDGLISAVDGLRGSVVKDKLDEGVVFHLTGDQTKSLPMWMDRNANFKVISPKYLIKHGL